MMLRRAFPWLLPALLALAFALPTNNATGTQFTSVERGVDNAATPVADTPHQPDDQTAAWSQWNDQDDDADRVIHADGVADWAPIAHFVLLRQANDVLRYAYRSSAAYPRGPPSA